MRRILVLALAAVTCSALAQTPPDVPANHWASKAVTDLYRLGVLKGYPDGLYRGTRPVTRYELAQALNGLYGLMKSDTDRLAAELADLRSPLSSDKIVRPPTDVQGLAELRRRLDSVEADAKGLPALKSETQELNSRFETLLQDLRKLREDVKTARGNMRNPRQ